RAGKEKGKESPEGSTKTTYKNPSFLPEFDKAIIDSIIDGQKTVLTHPPLNRLKRKLYPKLYLRGIQCLLKSGCLDSDAEDKFKQFESILIARQGMKFKTGTQQE
ncbi:unnamed protein product, partial [Porites evermanni]